MVLFLSLLLYEMSKVGYTSFFSTGVCVCVCVCVCGDMDTKAILQVTRAAAGRESSESKGIRHWKANERIVS